MAKKYRITDAEAAKVLIKNVNDRPNALATYGEAKMTPTQVKDLFDRQFLLVKEKHEALADVVEETENAVREMDEKVAELEEKVEGAEAVASEAANDAANATDTANSAMEVSNAAKRIADEVKARADGGEFKGEKGDPYILTEKDISVIVSATVNALPKYRGEAVDA